jgi:hypothetical protein
MVYMFANIKLRPGKLQKFTEMIGTLASVLEEKGGWKLHGSYFNSIGRMNTVVDVWEMPDANAVQSTLELASQDPTFQKLIPVIEECIEDETIQLMTKLPV